MYRRGPQFEEILQHRSLFLFGARQTGKSTLLHERFPSAVYFDLLEADTFRELSARPEYMRQTVPEGASLIMSTKCKGSPPCSTRCI